VLAGELLGRTDLHEVEMSASTHLEEAQSLLLEAPDWSCRQW
jgi:hypothetical protein